MSTHECRLDTCWKCGYEKLKNVEHQLAEARNAMTTWDQGAREDKATIDHLCEEGIEAVAICKKWIAKYKELEAKLKEARDIALDRGSKLISANEKIALLTAKLSAALEERDLAYKNIESIAGDRDLILAKTQRIEAKLEKRTRALDGIVNDQEGDYDLLIHIAKKGLTDDATEGK